MSTPTLPEPLTLQYVIGAFESYNIALLIKIIIKILQYKDVDDTIIDYLGLDHGTRPLSPTACYYPKLLHDGNCGMIDLVRIIRSKHSWMRIDHSHEQFIHAIGSSPFRFYEQTIANTLPIHIFPANYTTSLLLANVLNLTFGTNHDDDNDDVIHFDTTNPSPITNRINPNNDHPNLWLIGSEIDQTIELTDLFDERTLANLGFITCHDYFYWCKNIILHRFSATIFQSDSLPLFKSLFDPDRAPIAFSTSMSHPQVEMIKRETHPLYPHYLRRSWLTTQSFTEVLYRAFRFNATINQLQHALLILEVQNEVLENLNDKNNDISSEINIKANSQPIIDLQLGFFNKENENNKAFNGIGNYLAVDKPFTPQQYDENCQNDGQGDIQQPDEFSLDVYTDLFKPTNPSIFTQDEANYFTLFPSQNVEEHQNLIARIKKLLFHFVSYSNNSFALFIHLLKTFNVITYTPVTIALMYITINVHNTAILAHLNELFHLEVELRNYHSLPLPTTLDSYIKSKQDKVVFNQTSGSGKATGHGNKTRANNRTPYHSKLPHPSSYTPTLNLPDLPTFRSTYSPIINDTSTFVSRVMVSQGIDHLDAGDMEKIVSDPQLGLNLKELFEKETTIGQTTIFSYTPEMRRNAYTLFRQRYGLVDEVVDTSPSSIDNHPSTTTNRPTQTPTETLSSTLPPIPLNLTHSPYSNSLPIENPIHPYSTAEWYGGVEIKDDVYTIDGLLVELLKDYVYSGSNVNFPLIQVILTLAHENDFYNANDISPTQRGRVCRIITSQIADGVNRRVRNKMLNNKALLAQQQQQQQSQSSSQTLDNSQELQKNDDTNRQFPTQVDGDDVIIIPSIEGQNVDENSPSQNSNSNSTNQQTTTNSDENDKDDDGDDEDSDCVPQLEFIDHYSELFGPLVTENMLSPQSSTLSNTSSSQKDDTISSSADGIVGEVGNEQDALPTVAQDQLQQSLTTPQTNYNPASHEPMAKEKKIRSVSIRAARNLPRFRESAINGRSITELPTTMGGSRILKNKADNKDNSLILEPNHGIMSVDCTRRFYRCDLHFGEHDGVENEHNDNKNSTNENLEGKKLSLPFQFDLQQYHSSVISRQYGWFFIGLNRHYNEVEKKLNNNNTAKTSTTTTATAPTELTIVPQSDKQSYFRTQLSLQKIVNPRGMAQPVALYNWLSLKLKSSSIDFEHFKWLLSQDLSLVAVLCGYSGSMILPKDDKAEAKKQEEVKDTTQSSEAITLPSEPSTIQPTRKTSSPPQIPSLIPSYNAFVRHIIDVLPGLSQTLLHSTATPLHLMYPLNDLLSNYHGTLTVLVPPPLPLTSKKDASNDNGKNEKEGVEKTNTTAASQTTLQPSQPLQPSPTQTIKPSFRPLHPYPLLVPMKTAILFIQNQLTFFSANSQAILLYPMIYTDSFIRIIDDWDNVNGIPELFSGKPGPGVAIYMKNPSLRSIKPSQILRRELSILTDSLLYIAPHSGTIQPNVTVRQDKAGVNVLGLISDKTFYNFSSHLVQPYSVLNIYMIVSCLEAFITPSVLRLMEKSISRAYDEFGETGVKKAVTSPLQQPSPPQQEKQPSQNDSISSPTSTTPPPTQDPPKTTSPPQQQQLPSPQQLPMIVHRYEQEVQSYHTDFVTMLYSTLQFIQDSDTSPDTSESVASNDGSSENANNNNNNDNGKNNKNNKNSQPINQRQPRLINLYSKWSEYRSNINPLLTNRALCEQLVKSKFGARGPPQTKASNHLVNPNQRNPNRNILMNQFINNPNGDGNKDIGEMSSGIANYNALASQTTTTSAILGIFKIAIPVLSLMGALYWYATAPPDPEELVEKDQKEINNKRLTPP